MTVIDTIEHAQLAAPGHARCGECGQRLRTGEQYIGYRHGDKAWRSCLPCAGTGSPEACQTSNLIAVLKALYFDLSCQAETTARPKKRKELRHRCDGIGDAIHALTQNRPLGETPLTAVQPGQLRVTFCGLLKITQVRKRAAFVQWPDGSQAWRELEIVQTWPVVA